MFRTNPRTKKRTLFSGDKCVDLSNCDARERFRGGTDIKVWTDIQAGGSVLRRCAAEERDFELSQTKHFVLRKFIRIPLKAQRNFLQVEICFGLWSACFSLKVLKK
jgi:hypothetical protein